MTEIKQSTIHFETIHNKIKYTIAVSSTNSPSKDAIENCNKYVNILMRNL